MGAKPIDIEGAEFDREVKALRRKREDLRRESKSPTGKLAAFEKIKELIHAEYGTSVQTPKQVVDAVKQIVANFHTTITECAQWQREFRLASGRVNSLQAKVRDLADEVDPDGRI